MSVLYMLDSDTSSYIIKRRSRSVQENLSKIPPSSVCISVMTRAELLYGVKRLSADHPLQERIPAFLRIVQTLPWDARAADRYAEIRHSLVTSGQIIGELDMMIAAHALAAGATLVTNNMRHFQRIPFGLTLVNWHEED